MELYKKLIAMHIIKRSPDIKEDVATNKVKLDNESNLLLKSGAYLAAYALVMQDLLSQHFLDLKMDEKVMKEVSESKEVKRNWTKVIEELLEGRIKIDSIGREKLFAGEASYVHSVFMQFDAFI